jgi:hypothetical protein
VSVSQSSKPALRERAKSELKGVSRSRGSKTLVGVLY